MSHLRAGAFRAALVAVALTTAVAVPAAALPSTPAAGTVEAKQTARNDDSDFSYHIFAGRRDQAEAEGHIRWNEDRVKNEGDLFFDGRRGRGLVLFQLVSEDDDDFVVPKLFTTRDERATDFRVRESIDKIRITVCHVTKFKSECRSKTFFFEEDDD